VWCFVRGVGWAITGWLLWERSGTPVGIGGLILAGLMLLALSWLEASIATGEMPLAVGLAGLLYDFGLISLLFHLAGG
jgi:hypothetical protein